MNPEQILNRFSTHLKNVIAAAMSLATSMNHNEVTPLHILYSLLQEKGSIATEILFNHKINDKAVYEMLYNFPGTKIDESRQKKITIATIPSLNEDSKKILEKAMVSAYERQHKYVGTEHLLLALVQSENKEIDIALKKSKIDKQSIESQIEKSLENINNFPDINEMSNMMDQIENMLDQNKPMVNPNLPNLNKNKKQNLNVLDVFTTNLTDKKLQKQIDPVIGREREIERLINILSRRNKNNPVLIGEPGVGKTAIAEGLAKRISEGNVPDILKRKKILSLDMSLLLAGTIYRGEFEARLKQVMDEVGKQTNIILFIDELHNIIGAGSGQGAMDAANILKPALARGQLRCIGATTIDEYKKHITSDPALERRFQSINVEEPNREETIEILQGIKKYYENFHHTKITTEAIEMAVDLSIKYIHDNFLPDKAIDLIDEASASVKIKRKTDPMIEKKEKLLDELENYQNEKEQAILEEKFDNALKFKKKEEAITKKLNTLQKQISKTKKPPKKKVRAENVAKVLENKINIPSEVLLTNEWDGLNKLSENVLQYIVGQEKTVQEIIETLKQSQLGLKTKKKPFASFLFVGPSGVGKTELAKVLARELYHDEKALVKLDMSEFSEQHSSSKLLGSPAGYIGYKERNRFTDEIRKRPYCVVLFDEIDKAHPDVVKLLLQILDEGELTDSRGKKTHFNHTIIILTTNLGADLFKSSSIGFGDEKQIINKNLQQNVLSKLKEELSSALISRLDKLCLFSPLSEESIKQIIANNIELISQQLKEKQHISFIADDKALQQLVKESFDIDQGARNVEKITQKVIHDLVMRIMQKKEKKEKYIITKQKEGFKLK